MQSQGPAESFTRISGLRPFMVYGRKRVIRGLGFDTSSGLNCRVRGRL